MRIAYVITDLKTGGVPLHLLRLARAARHHGHDPVVISLAAPAEIAVQLRDEGVEVFDCGARRALDVTALWRLRRRLLYCRPDLVHAMLFHANLACRLVCPFAGIRSGSLLCEIQTVERERLWHLRLDRWTQNFCRWEIGNSPAVIEHLAAHGLRRDKLQLIAGGIDVQRYDDVPPATDETLGIAPGQSVVLWVGRLDPAKGLPDLLEAAAALPRALDVRWLLAGEGALRSELQTQIAALGIEQRVSLLGVRDDIPQLLARCDVFAFPSLTEGMPNALLEAMASRRAIVCTRIPAHEYMVEDGSSALLVEPRQPASLARAVGQLLENPARRAELGHNARRCVEERFTFRATVQRYLNLYEDLPGRSG